MRALQWLLAAVAVSALCVALHWTTSSRANAESPHTVTTRLEPGSNYVGWVGGDTPVEELFAAVPQIVGVLAWSPDADDWQIASRWNTNQGNSLQWLTPGMGLVVYLRGPVPVDWKRDFSRASGLVSLRPGFNLVAWTRDGRTTFSAVERDLQDTFRRQYPELDQADRDAVDLPRQIDVVGEDEVLEQGDALWVHVDEFGSWRQRGDSLSTIEGRVIGRDGQGVGGLTVQATSLGQHGRYFSGRTDGDGYFVIDPTADMQYTIGFRHRENCSSYYRVDGTTENVDDATVVDTSQDTAPIEFHVGEGACGWRIFGTVVSPDGNPHLSRSVGASSISFGRGASDTTDNLGEYSIIVPGDGDYNLSVLVVDSCRGWYDGDGLVQDRLAAATVSVGGGHVGPLRIQIPEDVCAWKIRGRILNYDGTPFTPSQIFAIKPDGQKAGSIYSRKDGSFELALPQPGSYRLEIKSYDDCSGFYADGALVTDILKASVINVRDTSPVEIVLRMPEQSCKWRISGQLLRADGSLIPRAKIAAYHSGTNVTDHGEIAPDGSFEIVTNSERPIVLRATIEDSCELYLGIQGLVTANIETRVFEPRIEGYSNIEFILDDGVCELILTGSILHADGQPLADAQVQVIRDQRSALTKTNLQGGFRLLLREQGEYRVRFELAPDCWAYYIDGMLSTSFPTGQSFRAADGQVTRLNIRVPELLCALEIRGILLDAAGNPMVRRTVQVRSVDNQYGNLAASDVDGRFAVPLPVPGSYRLWVRLPDRCIAVYSEGGTASEVEDGTIIVADEKSVDGIVVRDSDSSCTWVIRGRFVRPDGTPVYRVSVAAWIDGGFYGTATESALDGRFKMSLTDDTTRVLSVSLAAGCSVRYRGGPLGTSTGEIVQFTRNTVTSEEIVIVVPEDLCS